MRNSLKRVVGGLCMLITALGVDLTLSPALSLSLLVAIFVMAIAGALVSVRGLIDFLSEVL